MLLSIFLATFDTGDGRLAEFARATVEIRCALPGANVVAAARSVDEFARLAEETEGCEPIDARHSG